MPSHKRTPWAVGIIVGLVVAVLPQAAPAATPQGAAVVDPGLLAAVARGSAPAVLTWDRSRATRDEVAAHLRAGGVEATVFDGLPIAIACAATGPGLARLASAPGAISVWGEESLTPTVAESVPTAFNGDPKAVWEGKVWEGREWEGKEWPPMSVTGKGVTIAVVDTGVDGNHPDVAEGTRLARNVRVMVSHRELMGGGDPPPCQDFYFPETTDTELTSGHGTHMASVAAGDGSASDGQLKGMAPGATLFGVAITDSTSPEVRTSAGVNLSMFAALAGLNYVLQYGLDDPTLVKVVLAGWVGKGLHHPFHPIYLAIRDLAYWDISVVMPVGNGGPETSDCSAASTCTFNPYALGEEIIAVGATPKTSRTQLSSFSSRGDPVEREAYGERFRYEPTLTAPGEKVVAARRIGTSSFGTVPGSYVGAGGEPSASTDPHYVALTGTSVAAAHVAGTIALMQQAAREETGCFLSPHHIRTLLKKTATAMPGYQEWEAGAGAVDATAAVIAARAHHANLSPDPWVCPGM